MKIQMIKLSYLDQVGVVSSVSHIVASYGINIISLQVCRDEMFMEIEVADNGNLLEELYARLEELPQITSVETVKIIPFEARERQLKVVLDSVAEGILVIDHSGKIVSVNAAAENILKCDADKILGRYLKEVLEDDAPLETLRTGVPYHAREMVLNKPHNRIHFFSSGLPIKDNKGNIIGMVATVKDISEVKELIHNMTCQKTITFEDIIGNSPLLRETVEVASCVARSDSTVLLRGESGTGKELFARAIHMASPRYRKPFVPVNCAALPGELLESELFGYADGAFTGARKGGKPGLFESAGEGTIFLDEIGELSLDLQVKLLRVLQENAVRRVGATEENPINCRVIAATNRDLEKMVSEGAFREDLYYRINVVPLFIPPLRDRKEDIPLLANYFLNKLKKRVNKEIEGISPQAMEMLEKHDWPGNVRELENVLERAVNLARGKVIGPEQIRFDTFKRNRQGLSFSGGKKRRLTEMLGEYERDILISVLQRYSSSRKAAAFLGVSHTTILNKIKKHNLGYLVGK
jgi:transcriptional regulator of aroF, aroG, tyrA and aromatic amino acid transport